MRLPKPGTAVDRVLQQPQHFPPFRQQRHEEAFAWQQPEVPGWAVMPLPRADAGQLHPTASTAPSGIIKTAAQSSR